MSLQNHVDLQHLTFLVVVGSSKANPIIDLEGNIIAVDIIDGGYGYTSPPRIQVIDPCNNGSGAILETELLFNSAGKNTGRVRRVLVRDSGQDIFHQDKQFLNILH